MAIGGIVPWRWGSLRRFGEKEKKDNDVYHRERAYGSFRRNIELPGDVDTGKIEAAFKNGVLTIDLPKTKEAQGRVKQIPVKAA